MDISKPISMLIHDSVFKYFFIASNVISVVCWIGTLITDNYSQVDRIWSILPMVYSWTFIYTSVYLNKQYWSESTILPHSETSLYRLVIMSALVTLWGARLTYNYWRKGGYKMATEDYRWIYVRRMFNYPESKFVFHLFNIFFVAFFQNYLLLGLVVPMWYIQTSSSIGGSSQAPLNTYDLIVAALFLSFFLIEIIADQQQWAYQTKKYQWLESKKSTGVSKEQIDDFKRGFLVKGLFKFTRHPNFFGEISIWWMFYAFTLSSRYETILAGASPWSLINYSIFGTLSLTLLFHKSTNLTEKISAEKYPEYEKYKKHVSRIIPWISTYNPRAKSN